MTTISVHVFVHASLQTAYRAFTRSTSLREWLCDVATVDPRPNGRIYLWWNGDIYSSGPNNEAVENARVKFRWFSNIDPAPTEVSVSFTEKDGGVNIQLEHEVPDDEAWKNKVDGFRQHWEESFENLKSVLETGVDLRIANRPMLGIFPGDFTPEQAHALGIPVTEGLRLDGVVDGMGAQKAGLQKNDVLVEFGGQTIDNSPSSFASALAGKKGGETVKVSFYRGAEKKTVAMELGKRSMPSVPFDRTELEKRGREIYRSAFAELEKCFAGFTDEQAMKPPAPSEWSALETAAHLLQGERFNIMMLTSLIDGYEPVTDGFDTNIHAQVQAAVRTNPSIDLMLGLLRRTADEFLAFISLIPDEFIANKGSYYRFFGFGLLQPNFHLTAHIQQIKNALNAAKQ